jgi:hypothetical protein
VLGSFHFKFPLLFSQVLGTEPRASSTELHLQHFARRRRNALRSGSTKRAGGPGHNKALVWKEKHILFCVFHECWVLSETEEKPATDRD